MRNNVPSSPAFGPYGNNLPGSNYDDPKPVNTANYDNYLTQLTQPQNASGPAGALPLQAIDTTASNTSIEGVSINLDTGNFNFRAPVLALAGRAGLNLSLALSYSSKVWLKDPATSTMAFNADRGFPAPGWRLGFGALQVRDSAAGGYYNSITGKGSIIYYSADGTRHDLAWSGSAYASYDGTYLRYDSPTHTLSFPNGTRVVFEQSSLVANNYDFLLLPTKMLDRNGNFITLAYKTLTFAANNQKTVLDYVLDTAGRRIDFEYTNNRLTAIKQYREGYWFYFVQIEYAPVTIQTSFAPPLTTDPATINGTQVYLPVRLIYPTGLYHQFAYNTFGQMFSIHKAVPYVSGQGNGRFIAATSFSFSGNADCPSISSRSEWAENWQGGASQTYQYLYNTANGHEVTDPLGRRFRVLTDGLTQVSTTLPPGSSSWTKQETVAYDQDYGVPYRSNPRLAFRSVASANSSVRTTWYGYTQLDGVWLQTTRDDYIGNTGAIYRRTTTEYTSYPARRILGLPTQVSVYAGPGMTLMSRTINTYDETSSFTDSGGQVAQYFIDASAEGVIQHDDANYGASVTQRGNLTSVTQVSVANGAVNGSRITKRLSYDTNGNLRADTDGAGQRKQLVYTDYYYNKPAGVGQTHAYLYTSVDPTGFRSGSQYNYYSGRTVKTFQLKAGSSTEEQLSLNGYDFADRLNQTTRPDGGWTQIKYWDNWQYQVTAERVDQTNGQDQVKYSFQGFDGAGRVWRKAADHPDGVSGKYAGQQFIFDQVGRQSDYSNQIAAFGDWTPRDEDAPPLGSGWVYTNTTRDELERLKLLTRTDGNVVQYSYAGCDCGGSATTTVIDELGCQVKTETDFLGRTWKVSEMSAPNAPYNQVTYTYDVLDRLTQISHANGTGTQVQTRSFVYDGYGRLQSETTPEAGTISYTYKPNDLVETTTNALGRIATHTYNSRNLLTGTSYNDGGVTPAVTFQYDDYGARSQMTDGEGVTTYAYDSHRHLQSETRTFSGLPNTTTRISSLIISRL